MPVDLEHFERSLKALPHARAVMDKARACIAAWPDLYTLAHKTASQYLLQHTGKHLDPDNVWWHEFERAASAPTFTGWRHNGPPKQSMTFTQLLVHRFNDGFQLAPDALPVYGGFYSRGSAAIDYDQRNEIRLDAGQVMGDLWSLDFASLLGQRTRQFWREHGEDFTLVAKLRFVAMIEDGLKQGALAQTDAARLRAWLGLTAGAEPEMASATLVALQGDTAAGAFEIRHYLVAGGGHLITLRASDGRTVLYCPGTNWGLRAFANAGDLVHWLSRELRLPPAFDELYRVSQQVSAAERQQIKHHLLERIGPVEAPAWPFGVGRTINTDLFNELRNWAKADLAVSHALAVSNADLRKTFWRGHLGAFLSVFGSFAVLAWPLGLAMLGAGLARLTLDIDAAVRSDSVLARNEAILSVIADAAVVVFSIIEVGLGASALRFRAPPHERLALPRRWQATTTLDHELESLDGNRILPEPLTSPGVLQGVSVDDDGSTWIERNNLTLRVRYSPHAEGWLAVDDEDPFAFLPTYPLRVVQEHEWVPVDVAQPLPSSPGDLQQIASGFWDIYMQENAERSVEMSTTLLARQRQTLAKAGLPSPSVDNPLREHSLGYRYLPVGAKTWTSWLRNGQFRNDLIHSYTQEMTQANNLFRHGRGGDSEMLAYLTQLFDSLEQLPGSGAVRLWRGGSAQRATGGGHFRSGELTRGDVLVTTDITSFTENPYALREFVAPRQMQGLNHVPVFDDSSVVYELIGKGRDSGVPIGPMSMMATEAEVIFTPGNYFRIESIRDVRGAGYRFIKVRLREVEKPAVEPFYDMRTGIPFDRAAYLEQVGNEPLVERFFPAARFRKRELGIEKPND